MAPEFSRRLCAVLDTRESGRRVEYLVAVEGIRGVPAGRPDLPEIDRTAWSRVTETAEDHHEPGRFTAFIGFERTSNPERNNLPPNAIFLGGRSSRSCWG